MNTGFGTKSTLLNTPQATVVSISAVINPSNKSVSCPKEVPHTCKD